MDNSTNPIQIVRVYRCPECGGEDTGLSPTDTGLFESASDRFDVDKAICTECETLLPGPSNRQERQSDTPPPLRGTD